MLAWFNGDTQAEALYQDLRFVAHVWDDLVDKDKVVQEEDLHQAFEVALCRVPLNPFYQKWQSTLAPLIYTSCKNYRASRLCEQVGGRKQLEIAHFLRFSLCNVVVMMVELTNPGADNSVLITSIWGQVFDEDLEAYLQEMQNENTVAEG